MAGIPALRGIRRAYPSARLLLACGEGIGDWLTSIGVVDGVVPTKGLTPIEGISPPDVAVNLHGRGPQSHTVLRATGPRELFGFACPAAGFVDGPDWDESMHEVDRWCTLARWVGGRCDRADLRLGRINVRHDPPTVVVHPGAASMARRWPVDRWRRVIERLPGLPRVVVTGTSAEKDLCAQVCDGLPAECRAGDTSLAELAALIMESTLVLSGDTGVAHLATAYGVRSVTLFGPVSPAVWGPAIDPDLHHVIWHDDGTGGNPHSDRIDPRLQSISVEEVCAAVADLLNAPDPRPDLLTSGP